MFQFPGFALPKLCIHFGNTLVPFNPSTGEPAYGLNGKGGFPHSEIVGSKVAHTSPTLIAACHVLHRLCMPRHPRNALTSHLRVRTTNDSAVAPPMAIRMTINLSLIDCAIASAPESAKRDATASISRTHSQCQSRGQIPHPRGRNQRETDFRHPGTGGAYRDRTDDLKLAKLALSQLS
jgi:hypothetical protein